MIKLTIPNGPLFEGHLKAIDELVGALAPSIVREKEFLHHNRNDGLSVYLSISGGLGYSRFNDTSYNMTWPLFEFPGAAVDAYKAIVEFCLSSHKTWQVGGFIANIQGDELIVGCTRVPGSLIKEIAAEFK